MAHIIFKDITDFKKSVSGGANLSFDMQSIEGKIKLVARRHLIPWIGISLWKELVNTFDNLTPKNQTLLPYLQTVVGPLSLSEYTAIGSVQQTGNGLMRVDNEHYKGAYKYQENNYKQSHLDDGYEAIEWLLEFLWDNKDDYPLWTEEYQRRSRELFINSVLQFRKHYKQSISRYTFELLRPLMADVETFAIKPCLGNPFYDELKEKMFTEGLDDNERELLNIIQKCVSNFTIEEAMKRFYVQIKDGVVVQTEKLEPQSSNKEGTATSRPFATKLSHHESFANRYIGYLTSHLAANIDNFPTYKTWKEEQDAATASAANPMGERPDSCFPKSCTCLGACQCSDKGGAVILL